MEKEQSIPCLEIHEVSNLVKYPLSFRLSWRFLDASHWFVCISGLLTGCFLLTAKAGVFLIPTCIFEPLMTYIWLLILKLSTAILLCVCVCVCVCVHVHSRTHAISHIWLFVTPRTVTYLPKSWVTIFCLCFHPSIVE